MSFATASLTSTKLSILAQYSLFEHTPRLGRDVCIPDYTALVGGDVQTSNAWIDRQYYVVNVVDDDRTFIETEKQSHDTR